MVEYAQIECSRCFGIFPGNMMRRSVRSVEVGRTVQDSNPFDTNSVLRSLETAKTHYGISEVILCPNCRSKIRFRKFIRLVLFVAVAGGALYFYLDRSSFRFTDNRSDAVATEDYVADSVVPEDIVEQSDASIDPTTITETDAGSPDVTAPTEEVTTPNRIDEPTFASPSETTDALSLIVKQPVPKGNPGNWVTTNDYPSNALKDEREGTVKFTLDVDERGRVAACEIVESSGSDDLDEATCYNIQRRARFEPAADGNGAAIRSTFTNSVRWQIPS